MPRRTGARFYSPPRREKESEIEKEKERDVHRTFRIFRALSSSICKFFTRVAYETTRVCVALIVSGLEIPRCTNTEWNPVQ